MPKFLNLNEAFENCSSDGMFLPKDGVNIDKANTNFDLVNQDLKVIDFILTMKPSPYSTIYKLTYDVLHLLAETTLIFKQIKSNNHQCLFAYLCKNYPELELDWNFFELIRTKRNGVHYYSEKITKDDWKQIELQSQLYIKALKKLIKEKINSN